MDGIEEKTICDKYLIGDIGVSLEPMGVEESSSSNKCCARLRQFSVTDTITGVYKKFFKTGGDAQRSRVRNKVKAFVGYSTDTKNNKKGIFHWVLGSNWKMEEWEMFDEALKKMGRMYKEIEKKEIEDGIGRRRVEYETTEKNAQYAMVIEVGEKGGRLHAHVLFNRWYPVQCVRAAWETITGIEGVHVEARKGDIGASNYLSKYLTKEKGLRRGRRMFRTSKGLEKEIENYFEKKEGEMWICIE